MDYDLVMVEKFEIDLSVDKVNSSSKMCFFWVYFGVRVLLFIFFVIVL